MGGSGGGGGGDSNDDGGDDGEPLGLTEAMLEHQPLLARVLAAPGAERLVDCASLGGDCALAVASERGLAQV